MLNLAEYRKRPQALAEFLPCAALVANKDGSFQRTARFRGPELDSATPAELVSTTARLNGVLRRLGSSWAVFVEAQRVPSSRHPRSRFSDAASALVEMERQFQFEEEGAHFESAYFLTFVWLPPVDAADRAEGWLYENRAAAGSDGRAALTGFVDRTNRVLALLDGFMAEAAWLSDEETLTYLHLTVSTRRHAVRVPETPMHLDAILVDEPLSGGLEPRLGDAHLRTLTVMGSPVADLARPARRPQSARLPLPQVRARGRARQDRRHQGAVPHPPAMVRQAQVDRRHRQGGDDQRVVGADGFRRRQ